MKFIAGLLLVAGLALVNARSGPTNFVTNGMNAPAGSATYHAHILIRENAQSTVTRVGSGVLISTQHVLTTGTNTQGFGWWNVGFGNTNRELLEWRESTTVQIHPQFTPANLNNNLAIITFAQAIITTPNVQPVRMPTLAQTNFPMTHDQGRVTGFGFTANTGNFATQLQLGFQRVIENNLCLQAFPNLLHNGNIFCGSSEQSNICAGDQGAAMVSDIQLTPTLIGIASITDSACSNSHPTVYTRINSYREWIQDVTLILWN